MTFNIIVLIPLSVFMVEAWNDSYPLFGYLYKSIKIPIWIYTFLDIILLFVFISNRKKLAQISENAFTPNMALHQVYGRCVNKKLKNTTTDAYKRLKVTFVFETFFLTLLLIADTALYPMFAVILLISLLPSIKSKEL